MDSFWKDRNVLVTGATGFLGGWLVRRLKSKGSNVYAVIRDENSDAYWNGVFTNLSASIMGDVCHQAGVERVLGEYEIDTVFHLAAQTIVGIANCNPLSTFESNIKGTWTVLEACRRSPKVKRIVVASSDKAYGKQAKLPYTEQSPLLGRYPYDVSKACADMVAQSYAETYDMPIVITRCGNFFGGGDLNWSRLVPSTIRSMIHGEHPVIRSDGTPKRDYFYVEDGAAAYMHLAEQIGAAGVRKGTAVNLSYGEPLTVLEMVARITKAMGGCKWVIKGEATKEIQDQYLASYVAREVFSWKPEFTLDEGIKRTIQWYQQHLSETPVISFEGS